jgi:excisionase family DNA binding protein
MAASTAASERKRLVPTAVVAERLGMKSDRVRQLAAQGEIPGLRFGRRGFWRFDPDEVEAAIERAKR